MMCSEPVNCHTPSLYYLKDRAGWGKWNNALAIGVWASPPTCTGFATPPKRWSGRGRRIQIFGGQCHPFWFLFQRLVLRRVHFLYKVMLIGGLLGGVDVKWSAGLLDKDLFCIDVFVVRVKVSRRIEPFSPIRIDSADTSQLPNGDVWIHKPHLLPNNPARQ